MKISIVNKFTPDGREFIEWDIWYGPGDGSDHAHGYAVDLVQAFAKIFEWKERMDRDYAEELHQDTDTLKNFLSDNETD
jgi:hypothetical protein